MITLQFWRGLNQEGFLSRANRTTYKLIELGYPLLSFVSDLELSPEHLCQDSADDIPHVYFGIDELRNNVNLFDVKFTQSLFIKIFNEQIQNGRVLDLEAFENISILYGLEVPFHGIIKQGFKGKEIICDYYNCFYIKGFTKGLIEQLCVAELHHLTTNGYIIKRCENCGKLFVPQKADEKYCIRRSEEYPNMNCKQAAKYKKQLLRESKNPSAKAYHSIYTMLAKRAKNAPLSEQSTAQQDLANFANEAVKWKARVKADASLESDYIAWLNSFKRRTNNL